jgi:hypothetical protein
LYIFFSKICCCNFKILIILIILLDLLKGISVL